MSEHLYSTYILASSFHRLYAGVTNNLETRMKEHKNRADPNSFTARYGIDRLVYYERFQYINDAIAREKEIKRWSRPKKIALIVQKNPTWVDLSEQWGKAIQPFEESRMRVPETF